MKEKRGLVSVAVRCEGGSASEYARQLFSLLSSFDDEKIANNYLAMEFSAYIDDSADRDRERVIISGAIIGDFDNWRYLARYWNKRLKQDGIEYFKSTHCRHLRGQFFKFNSLKDYPPPKGREVADGVRDDLEILVGKAKLISLGIIIPVPLFNKLGIEPLYASAFPPDPYHWAVQSVWRESAKIMRKLQMQSRRPRTVNFAHDDSSNFHILHKLFLSYKAKNPGDAHVLGDFVPRDDKAHPPIQCADLVADVVFRYSEAWAQNPTPANLTRLRKTMYKISIWDEDYARSSLDLAVR